MTPRQGAEKIIEMFKPYVYCYMGSGMLSNTYDEDVVRMNAIQCAIKHIEGILEELLQLYSDLCHNPYSGTAVRNQVEKYDTILSELKSM